jgi:predicted pyridoxine 5'-phosphate oxidase superfamily flavin-nucleotide-binding protein
MATLPEVASKAWEDREGPAVFTTVDEKGVPNTIYVTWVRKIGDDKMVVADNKFHKTRANIMAGSKASLLYITKEKKAYQIKGSLEYLTDGEIYEDMKNGWLDKKYAGNAATVIHIEEVYSGAEKLA